ncbi:MAG: hypothetical protein LH631_13830 [Alkalinema sp. CAN_BIN05]|nr:hypothetical protein [Alkalinema sp. CAN_BIN05]
MIFTAVPPIVPITIPNKKACPTTIAHLAELLVRDLPSYANRAALKNGTRFQVPQMSQVIVASQPNLEPLRLPGTQQVSDPNLHQVFITTLERQTFNQKNTEFQLYHWLFLVQTRQGWKLSQSFTRISPYPFTNKITPPRESSQSITAQAIKTWLRDCQAGVIRQ